MFNHESFVQQYIWNDKFENTVEISPQSQPLPTAYSVCLWSLFLNFR